MQKTKKLLREIEVSIRRVDIFLLSIKTLVLLMVAYLLFFVTGIEPYYAFVPAIVYFVSSVFVEARVDDVKRVERKYTNLNEKLRTARDYKDKDNIVLESLEHDIIREAREVKVSSFISFPRICVLVVLLVLSVSLSLYIARKDLRIINFDIVVQEAMRRFAVEEKINSEADFTGGEESIMTVGNERIEVEINPVGLDFDFNEVTEAGDYEFSAAFPRDIFISSGAAYENEFTEEQQALIKRYFDKKKG